MIDTNPPDVRRPEQHICLPDGRNISVKTASEEGEDALIRYAEAAARTIQAAVQPQPGSPDGQSAKLPARLIEISRVGAKLIVPANGCSQGPAKLHLQAPHLDLNVEMNVRVGQVKSIDAKVAQLGCQFVEPLPSHVISKLAAATFVERRQGAARINGLRAVARQQLAGGQGAAVIIEDVSQHGFRLISDQSLNVGERMLLQVAGADGEVNHIAAQARWQIADGEQFQVGCSILAADDTVHLQTAYAAAVKSKTDDSKAPLRPADVATPDRVPDVANRCEPPSTGERLPPARSENPSQPAAATSYPRQVQRIIALTDSYRVEGTLHYMQDTRLSDFMNSENTNSQRYLPLSDVTVTHLQSGQQSLQTEFMMLAHSQITGISPNDSICELASP